MPPGPAAVRTSAGGELSQIRTADFHSMAISPVNPDGILYGHHGGVLRSIDGGRTWPKTNLAAATDDAMGMGISSAEPEVAYAAGHDTFFKSTDGGRTWKTLKGDLPGRDIHGMAVAPDKAGRLYANIVRFGFYRSDDGGDTWKKAASGPFPVDVVQVSASAGGVVYIASAQGGVLRSDDAGATFTGTAPLSGSVLTVAASATDSNAVYAGTSGEEIGELTELTVAELKRSAGDITEAEVARARAQLKAGMLMGLESPSSRAERLARLLSIWGRVPDVAEAVEKIDAVDVAATRAFGASLAQGAAALALYGPVADAPGLDDIREGLSG